MKRAVTRVLSAVALLASPTFARDADRRPNVLVIVADDLGYSDIGAFGGEIDTPNLDSLAARGLRLTNFHTAPSCSPTRSMLLTGLDHHEAGLGNMAEALAPNQKGKPGHEGHLRADVATLPELLAADGYRTHFSGKWHLGMKPDQDPHARGFETSFALLQGLHNHFGRDVSGASGRPGSQYTQNGEQVTSLPRQFYSSDFFVTTLIEQLEVGGADAQRPFFAYLAFTAPHFPLQAPPETIARYKGRYDAGYDVLRQERLERQVRLGLLDPAIAAHELDLAPPWNSLTPEQKAREARRMEVYAAMVNRLDHNVGRLLRALKEMGEYENTVILFLADNGAEGADLSEPAMGAFNGIYAAADNGLANIGAATSFEYLGPGWAGAASAPFWRGKAFQSEGGTRVVAFVAGPGIRSGVDHAYTNVMDVMPTILDLAHVSLPQCTFRGRAVKRVRGLSWIGWLGGTERRVYGFDKAVGGELFGGRSLRRGRWKITDIGDGNWLLFDIEGDPAETRDMSGSEPARKAALIEAWSGYAQDVGVVMPATRQAIIDRPIRR